MTPTLTPRPSANAALVLRFSGDSWVQVQAPDGRTLEKGLLPAGTTRTYVAGEVGRVTLGNASAVVVQQAATARRTSRPSAERTSRALRYPLTAPWRRSATDRRRASAGRHGGATSAHPRGPHPPTPSERA